jgi:hypothetical protein
MFVKAFKNVIVVQRKASIKEKGGQIYGRTEIAKLSLVIYDICSMFTYNVCVRVGGVRPSEQKTILKL